MEQRLSHSVEEEPNANPACEQHHEPRGVRVLRHVGVLAQFDVAVLAMRSRVGVSLTVNMVPTQST